MQLVNGAQFLNITFLLVLFEAAPSSAVLLTDIFPLTSIYVSLQSHKLDFYCFKSDLFIRKVCTSNVIIYFDPISKFRWFI